MPWTRRRQTKHAVVRGHRPIQTVTGLRGIRMEYRSRPFAITQKGLTTDHIGRWLGLRTMSDATETQADRRSPAPESENTPQWRESGELSA